MVVVYITTPIFLLKILLEFLLRFLLELLLENDDFMRFYIVGLQIKKYIFLLVIEILVDITLLKFQLRFLLEILLGFLLGDLLNIRDIMRHC